MRKYYPGKYSCVLAQIFRQSLKAGSFFVAYFVLSSLSFAQDYNWSNVAIGGGGFVSSVIAAPNDPNVFYARTDVGGAYRWDQNAASWVSLLDWVSADERGLLGIDGIALDPNVAGRVYMLAGTSYWNNGKSMFLRSDDYGQTWDKFDVTSQFKAHGNGMGRGCGERIAVDPNNSDVLFIGSRFDGMWKSTNRGASWSQVSSFPVVTTQNEAGTPIIVFDGSSEANGVSQTIYAGVAQANDNLYVSHDAGATWALVPNRPVDGGIMPQRIALTADGQTMYVTYGNGAGPHAMLWSGVTDYYNRGAVYKYQIDSAVWTDISPQNFMQDLDQVTSEDIHYGAYSGISIDPNDENRILATSINSWRGPQYWNNDGTYQDSWGDNIFLSVDGGVTWRAMFRYYWQEGGMVPDYEILDDNGIEWIRGSNIHWNGAITFDPNNADRAFVTSGNGVWATDNLSDFYTTTEWVDNVQTTVEHGRCTWKFVAHGIEETVPEDLVSIQGGPMVSVILDYDGFVHEDVNVSSQYGRHQTNVSGTGYALGSTTGIALAAQNGRLAKVTKARSVSTQYNDIPIGPVQWSTDNGLTWTAETYVSNPPAELSGGKVALSGDGAVTLWMPASGSTMYRNENSSWAAVSGINFAGSRPIADHVNADVFYVYNPADGYVYVSDDKGISFSQSGYAGLGVYETMRAIPGNEGDIWVPLTNNGLTRSLDGGQTFALINNVSYCEAVGYGKAATGSVYPTIFIFGTVNNVTGVFRSVDQGATWVRVNDDEHEYGGLANGEFVMGDMNVFGRVYMSTAGRGIVYGDPSSGGTANQQPIASFTSSATSGEAPLSISFDASGSSDADGDVLSYSWNFGDGNSATGVQASYTYSSAGDYTVLLTVNDANGGISTTSQLISVTASSSENEIPVASFTSSATSGEAPLSISFDASGSSDADGDVLSYSWDFGDGNSAAGVQASYTYSLAGDYTVLLTVNDGNGGISTTSQFISVIASSSENEIPVASFTASATSGEAPLSISFDASGSSDADGDVLSYSWDFGDGNSATGVQASYTYSSAGDYTVVLTVNDGNGGQHSASVDINVTQSSGGTSCDFGTPLAAALPSGNHTYNNIHVIGSGGPDLSNVTSAIVNWSLENNGLWQFSFSTNNGNPGWYNDLRSAATVNFNVSAPSITFSGSGFPGLDGTYYVAYDGDNFVFVSQSDDYVIYCSNDASAPSCSSSRVIGQDLIASGIIIFPNPVVNSDLRLKMNVEDESSARIEVINTAGQVLHVYPQELLQKGENEKILNVGELSAGVYVLKVIIDQHQIKTQTFLKQ